MRDICQIWLPAITFFSQTRRNGSLEKDLLQTIRLKAKADAYFAEMGKSHYTEGITISKGCWSKCITLQGDYVEK